MRKIIIDTDPGIDDTLALMLAIKSEFFDIQAITTVCGNSTIENTTRNVRYILQLLERTDIPVYSGARKPLSRELIKASIHGKSGLEGINPSNEPKLTGNAVDKLIEIIKTFPNEITLIALGPLTNIALAIQKDIDAMKLVKEIIIMGGAIRVPGNMNRVAEFNMFVDPEAAQIVTNLSVKKTLVPLDVSNTVQMHMQDFKKIKNKVIKEPLLKMIEPYIINIEKDTGIAAALMYDPLTVFALLSPQSCEVNSYNIQVETKGEFTRGMTVADLRNVKDTHEQNYDVVKHIVEEEFKEKFIAILNK